MLPGFFCIRPFFQHTKFSRQLRTHQYAGTGIQQSQGFQWMAGRMAKMTQHSALARAPMSSSVSALARVEKHRFQEEVWTRLPPFTGTQQLGVLSVPRPPLQGGRDARFLRPGLLSAIATGGVCVGANRQRRSQPLRQKRQGTRGRAGATRLMRFVLSITAQAAQRHLQSGRQPVSPSVRPPPAGGAEGAAASLLQMGGPPRPLPSAKMAAESQLGAAPRGS